MRKSWGLSPHTLDAVILRTGAVSKISTYEPAPQFTEAVSQQDRQLQ